MPRPPRPKPEQRQRTGLPAALAVVSEVRGMWARFDACDCAGCRHLANWQCEVCGAQVLVSKNASERARFSQFARHRNRECEPG